MNEREPQPVTRTYARGLVAAVVILAIALLIAVWGAISLFFDRSPVESNLSTLTAPLIILVAMLLLVVVLWRQVLEILRGKGPEWANLVVLPSLAYLVWCLGGVLAGMRVEETWLSPYAFSLAGCWAVALLIFWGVFLRRVYSGRQTPQWPWEKKTDDDEDR